MRWQSTGKTEGRYETSIASYRNAAGVLVDLISVVHIGDSKYYADLSRRFEAYDALLYELVAPKGSRPRRNRKVGGGSIISQVQRLMKTALNLQFQLDAIDYSADNFVHADLSPKEFLAKQKERGESMTTMMIRAMLAGSQSKETAEKAAAITPIHIMAGMRNPDYLKFLFAQQLENVENILATLGGGGKGENSTIIGDRNQAAIDVLKTQLRKGKKRVGIFYGAAHMPDLEVKLKELGFEPAGKPEWLVAWDVTLSDDERAQRKALEERKAKRRAEVLERRRQRREAAERAKKEGREVGRDRPPLFGLLSGCSAPEAPVRGVRESHAELVRARVEDRSLREERASQERRDVRHGVGLTRLASCIRREAEDEVDRSEELAVGRADPGPVERKGEPGPTIAREAVEQDREAIPLRVLNLSQPRDAPARGEEI